MLLYWCTSTFLTFSTVKNSKMFKLRHGGGRHLEKSLISISRSRFERFRRNLAQWCSSTLLTVLTVKKLKFWKSNTAVAAILKNIKITISRPRFKRFLWNLARWHIICTLYVRTTIILSDFVRIRCIFCMVSFTRRVRIAGGRFWLLHATHLIGHAARLVYY